MLILSFSTFAQDSDSEVTTLDQPQDKAETPALVSSAETDVDDDKFNPFSSHWLTAFGFETSKYEVPFEYEGTKKNFRKGDQTITGGRLGFGGEIYLGAGFATTSKVEGFYMGSLFTKAKNAGPEDTKIEFASSKKTSSVWGVEASQSLSYIFEMKTRNPFMGEWTYLTVEPFVEAGIGKAFAYNSVNYRYDLADAQEFYRERVSDNLLNARIGGGINFTSRTGYFLYLKATQNRYDVTDRKIKGAYRKNGETADTSLYRKPNNVKMDAVMVFALGGGYKF